MSAVSLGGLFRSCIGGFEVIESAKGFGVQYELLCTELSIQQLRFQVWGDSVSSLLFSIILPVDSSQIGLDPALPDELCNTILDKPGIRETLCQTLDSIKYLLAEAGKLKDAYRHNGAEPVFVDHKASLLDIKRSNFKNEPGSSLGFPRPVSRLRQRMQRNQKHITILGVAKWAIIDARAFEAGLIRLRGYLDNLESISRSITSSSNQPQNQIQPAVDQNADSTGPPPYSLTASNQYSRPGTGEHIPPNSSCHTSDPSISSQNPSNIGHREYVYDEVRKGLSSRSCAQRRHRPTVITTTTTTTTTVVSKQPTILGHSFEGPQPNISSQTNARNKSVEIFKSFRVSMMDPVYKVLPAALKKYNITGPPSNYDLYIVYGDQERRLEMQEMPLMIFKRLDKEGKRPMFMLRKKMAANVPMNVSMTFSPRLPLPPSPLSPLSPGPEDLVTTYVRGYTWSHINGEGDYRYEIRAYYRHGFEMSIWRTYHQFIILHSGLQASVRSLDSRLPQLPHRLSNRPIMTTKDVEALHRYFKVLLSLGDSVRLSRPFQQFFESQNGDESVI